MSRYSGLLSTGAAPNAKAQKPRQFKEAFSLIDQDNGHRGRPERHLRLSGCFVTFTTNVFNFTRQMLDDLLTDRIGQDSCSAEHQSTATALVGSARGVNFTMFLTMMGEHLFEFDAGQELIEAFECFDESDTGFVKVDGMRRWLSEVVDRMEPAEIDQLFKGPFTDRNDNFNCREWIKILRINADTEQDGEAS